MSIGWMVALWLATSPQPPRTTMAAARSTATAGALAKAVETSARLAALPKREFGDPRVPDFLQPQLHEAELDRTLHRQIGDFVEAWLREHGVDAPTDQIAEELRLDLLWGVTVDVKIAVVRPADDPELLAVSWETQLVYLGNSSLLSFVSDWIDAPWRDARQWSARGGEMRRWHRLLREIACQLERGRQWGDACEATRREVLELVLVLVGGGGGGEGGGEEQRLSLFFLFDADETLRLLDITAQLPAGVWYDLQRCDGEPAGSPDQP